MNIKQLSILTVSGLLFGCSTSKDEEIIMPAKQQNSYLSHAKMPQHFGFQAYQVHDGIAIRGQARQHPNHLATVQFEKGNIPAIQLTGPTTRRKITALLDTKSPASWIEFSKSQEMDAIFLGIDDTYVPYRGRYNTGEVPGYAAVLKQLRIDQLFIENTPIYVRMAMNSLGPIARGISVPHIDAVLGYDMLQTFEYIQFDFDANIVKFSSSIAYVPHPELLMSTATIRRIPNFGLAVAGAVDGRPTDIVLDFAGDYDFSRSDMKVNMTRQVDLGDVVFRRVPTLLLPTDKVEFPPHAGRRMLEDYIVTVCPRGGVVFFERIPEK